MGLVPTGCPLQVTLSVKAHHPTLQPRSRGAQEGSFLLAFFLGPAYLYNLHNSMHNLSQHTMKSK